MYIIGTAQVYRSYFAIDLVLTVVSRRKGRCQVETADLDLYDCPCNR